LLVYEFFSVHILLKVLNLNLYLSLGVEVKN
jgi:hypothetical protein